MMEWRRASSCGANGACVEVLEDGPVFWVKNSRGGTGEILSFTHDEWVTFIEGVKAGEFDPGFTRNSTQGDGRQDFSR